MNKRTISMLLSILTIAWFAFPLCVHAEAPTTKTPQDEVIGTITLTENGEIIITPMAAAVLNCSLRTTGGKYYGYAQITSGLTSNLKVAVYLKNSAGTTLASGSGSGTGTVITAKTATISLSPGVYTVYATGTSNSTSVSLTKYYSVP